MEMTSGKRTLFSDCSGRISRLAVQITAKLFNPGNIEKRMAYEALLQSFPHDVVVSLLVDAAIQTEATAWLSNLDLACRIDLVAVSGDKVTLSGAWMRDAFICADQKGTTQYLRPWIGKLNGEQAEWLAAIDGNPVVHLSDIFLDGGDSLVGPEFRLVGNTAINTTREVLNHQCDYVTALRRFSELDHRRLYPVGYRPSLIKHRLLWFRDQIRRRIESARQSKIVSPPTPIVFPPPYLVPIRILLEVLNLYFRDGLVQDWAHIDLVVSVTGRKVDGKDVLLVAQTVPSNQPSDEEILESERLDALAAYFLDCGFDVLRNPAPYAVNPGATLYYNNGIVQTKPDKVWVPQFSDQDPRYRMADQGNVEIWEQLGFEVVPVHGWFVYVASSGSIRCATNVLARE